MKKIILTFAAMLLSFGIFAQTETTNKAAKQQRNPNGFMIRDGRVMQVKDGNLMLIEKDITLSNGNVIMADGNYMIKGKSKAKLNEGEHLDVNGNLISSSKPKTK